MKAKIILFAIVALMLVSFTAIKSTESKDKPAQQNTTQTTQGGFASEDPNQWD